ncbi:MAG TPA: hypothetical protein VEZ47_09245, partial [Gemmatirosa sp.]|nr:hypothetical protein [Gemmatirosa sp.]
EARAGHRAAEAHAWAVVRHAWPGDDRGGVSELLHAVSALLAARPCWWIVPGREPQAVPLASDAVLDNPFGFAALAEGHELVLLDAELPAGLWLGHPPHDAAGDGWAVEVWGTEPWLSAATRALREWRARRDAR